MENKKLINILVDFAFKKVFAGDGEDSKIILTDFLNSILDLKYEDKIQDIVYLNPFNDRNTDNDKQSIMDIKIKTQKDEYIDIEIQLCNVDDYRKRSLYYWSNLYNSSLKKGESYFEAKKSIVISILDFKLFDENEKYHNIFKVKEIEDNFVLNHDLEIHYIELSKFNEHKDFDNINSLEEWIVFLKECNDNGDDETIQKLLEKKEEIGMAVKIMEKLSADELEYERYLAREKYLRDEISKKRYAEIQMNKVKEELSKIENEKNKIENEKNKIENEKNKIEDEKNRVEQEKEKIEKENLKLADEKEKAEIKSRQMQEEKEQQALKIAASLKGLLEDETISEKTGLSLDIVKQLS